MNLQPLLAASPAIQLHVLAAVTAFVLGMIQLAGPKGVLVHRVLGWAWVAAMAIVAVSSFWIREVRETDDFSPIHLLSIFTIVMLPLAIMAARRHNVKRHRGMMIGLFVGALVVAGGFTFLPGRIMHALVF